LKGLNVNRHFVRCCVLATALALPAVALATPRATEARFTARVVMRGSVTGTVLTNNGSAFTIQTPGRPTGVVNALTAAANKVTKGDYPYVYGGGHAEAGIASVGIPGPGYNGHRIGYDCSGSVAAVLAGAGLWPAGGGVPNDAGIIVQLLHERLIARGAGTGPVEVTLYDDPGVHIFMNIDGRFFGTSDGGGGGDAKGGAGWLYDGAPDAFTTYYRRYHLLPSVLKGSTNAGHIVTFQAGAVQSAADGLEVGEKVEVSYEQTSAGNIVATAISYPGALATSGTVQSIAGDASSFTITTSSGSTQTFSTAGDSQLAAQLGVGDTVQVTYTTSGSTMIAVAVQVTGTPAPSSGSGDGGSDGNGGPGSPGGNGDGGYGGGGNWPGEGS
jgi:hypothetical protein